MISSDCQDHGQRRQSLPQGHRPRGDGRCQSVPRTCINDSEHSLLRRPGRRQRTQTQQPLSSERERLSPSQNRFYNVRCQIGE